jgi:hypothetical protein
MVKEAGVMNTVLPVAFLTSLCNDKFLHEITDQPLHHYARIGYAFVAVCAMFAICIVGSAHVCLEAVQACPLTMCLLLSCCWVLPAGWW